MYRIQLKIVHYKPSFNRKTGVQKELMCVLNFSHDQCRNKYVISIFVFEKLCVNSHQNARIHFIVARTVLKHNETIQHTCIFGG